MKHSTKSGKARVALPKPQQIYKQAAPRVDFQRLNLIDEMNIIEDPPAVTHLIVSQYFEPGKDIEGIQEVELSRDEYEDLRIYLAQLRGLRPPPAAQASAVRQRRAKK